jgi:two-component system, NarL family, response regulator YdfI
VKKTSMRVLIVADHDTVAATVEAALRDRPDVHLAVGRPRALRQLIDEGDPAVVVLATTTARATATLDSVVGTLRVPPIVLLVDDSAGAWTATARRAGVRAVLGQEAGAEQISAAIAAAAAGLVALHPDALRARTASPRPADVDGERSLTARQREILEMMAAGLSNRAIAARLGISAYTVKFHVASILDKLGAGTRTEAVTLGVRNGLISL